MSQSRRARPRRPPEVEPLEALTLLSGLTTSGRVPATAAVVTPPILPIPVIVGLSGTTTGAYTTKSFPDAGTTYTVKTHGTFTGYGQGTENGTLHSLGLIVQGHATGTLVVTLPRGTLTLQLTGPLQRGGSPLPREFSFTITKGTGAFHDKVGDPVGKGTVVVTFTGTTTGTNTVSLKFTPGVVVAA